MVKMARMMHLVGLLPGLCLPGLALAQEIADAPGKAARLWLRRQMRPRLPSRGLSPGEIAAYAPAQGKEAIPARERAVLEEMLLIDANRDGFLSMAEMRAALARLRPG